MVAREEGTTAALREYHERLRADEGAILTDEVERVANTCLRALRVSADATLPLSGSA